MGGRETDDDVTVERHTDTQTQEPLQASPPPRRCSPSETQKGRLVLCLVSRHPNIITLRELIPPSSLETFEDMFVVTDFMEAVNYSTSSFGIN